MSYFIFTLFLLLSCLGMHTTSEISIGNCFFFSFFLSYCLIPMKKDLCLPGVLRYGGVER